MFLGNVFSAYAGAKECSDKGDLVQTIIIVATFAVVAIAAIGLIGNAIMTKGAKAADCIIKAGSSTIKVSGDGKCTDKLDAEKSDCESKVDQPTHYVRWNSSTGKCDFKSVMFITKEECDAKVYPGWTYTWNAPNKRCDWKEL